MGIQINGQTDNISAVDGSLTISGAELPTVTNLTASGIITASGGISVAAGSTSSPSISPSGDSNTGIFFPSPDTIAFAEGGIEGFRLDSSGRVTMPNQPAFDTIGSGTLAFSGGTVNVKITLASALTNVSGSYSTANSRFIAPVSGTYLFYLSTATTTATSTGPALLLFKNGSSVKEIALNYSNVFYTQFSGSIVVSAVANDFFELYISNYNNTSFTIDLSRTSFGGFLIG
jgi:hypothetical protein